MIENRLELNKKKVYELPSEIVIESCFRFKGRYRIPKFTPSVRINAFGLPFRVLGEGKELTNEIWFYTKNTELINFISSFDWNSLYSATAGSSGGLSISIIKKIILEEFYCIKGDEHERDKKQQ